MQVCFPHHVLVRGRQRICHIVTAAFPRDLKFVILQVCEVNQLEKSLNIVLKEYNRLS